MVSYKVYDEDGQGFTRITQPVDVEYVNPMKFYSDFIISNSISLEKDILLLKDPALASLISDDLYFQRAKEKLFEKYRKIENTTIPQNFIKLFRRRIKKGCSN
jgi:hypothetical protein